MSCLKPQSLPRGKFELGMFVECSSPSSNYDSLFIYVWEKNVISRDKLVSYIFEAVTTTVGKENL